MKISRILTTAFTLAISVSVQAAATFQTYRYHPQVEKSSLYSAAIDGTPQTVLTTDEPDFMTFGASEETCVDITYHGEIKDVIVRPVVKNIRHEVNGNVIKVWLNPYDRVSVEVNGDLVKPLFIFVNPIEKAPKFSKNQNVRRYKAGNIYEEEKIEMNPGDILYLEPGAIVHGCVVGQVANDAQILGYGIIDARVNDKLQGIRFRKSTNVRLEGPVLLNSTLWSTVFIECNGVTVNNYKVIATRSIIVSGLENDGIHLFGTSNAKVTRCFAFAHDDAFVCNSRSDRYGWAAPVDNVLFEDCVGWNVRGGNTFEIGYATREDMSNITYRNIYAIHSNTFPRSAKDSGRGGIGVHHGSNATITNLTYENVFIEDPYSNAIHFAILKTTYDNIPDWEGGHINNTVFKNVHILKQGPSPSEFFGVDDKHAITGLVFDGLYFGDKKITNLEEAGFGRFDSVKDCTFK